MNDEATKFDFKAYADPSYRATFDPDDQKIRIYTDRVARELYDALKGLGFGRAYRQECFFQVWSPAREDAALALCGDIFDEDTSIFDRASAREMRFATYSDHAAERAEDAHEQAKEVLGRFEFGQPILVGHHSERKARKDHDRADALATRAVEEYDRSSYWGYRARAVLRHAERTHDRGMVMRRIKKLEADRRSHVRTIEEFVTERKLYTTEMGWWRNGQVSWPVDKFCKEQLGKDPCEFLSEFLKTVTDEQAQAIRAHIEEVQAAREQFYGRWVSHLDGEISYWKALLEEKHGVDVDEQIALAKGCWVRDARGWIRVKRVNKGAEGRITSVSIDPRPGDWSWMRTVEYDRIKEWKTAADYQAERERLDLEAEAERIAKMPKYEPPAPDPERERLEALAEAVKAAEVKVNWDKDYFSTPPDAVRRMVDLLKLEAWSLIVLEPSAGDGRIADEVRRRGKQHMVHCCEINWEARQVLERNGHKLVGADFLEYELPLYTDGGGQFMYDRIVMNPPWGRRQWERHLEHAWELLRPGGRLVALLPAVFPQDKAAEFVRLHGHVDGNLVGGFEGTTVKGVVVMLDKPEEPTNGTQGKLF